MSLKSTSATHLHLKTLNGFLISPPSHSTNLRTQNRALLLKTSSPPSSEIIKSGRDLLESLQRHTRHPLLNHYNKALTAHVKAFGDGSKTILLLLGYLLRKLESRDANKALILREMFTIRDHFLPLLGNQPPCLLSKELEPRHILEPFFASRLSTFVAKNLIDLVINLYNNGVSPKEFEIRAVLLGFESVSSSRILQMKNEVLIDSKLFNPFKIHPKKFHLVLDNKLGSPLNPVKLISQTLFSVWIDVWRHLFDNSLVDSGIDLILCSFGLEDNLKSYLLTRRILTMEYLDEEELLTLCEDTKVQSWSGDIGDEIGYIHVGEIT
ncbi:Uncharacterized protein FKW44_009647, partial [Caligus rogercresseyi]